MLTYEHRHPDWQASRRKLEEQFEREMLHDREIGKLDARLTAWDIREMARKKAIEVVQTTANAFEDKARANMQRKAGEAA